MPSDYVPAVHYFTAWVTPMELKNNAQWLRHIEARHLIASQLPPTLTDATGTITKPPTW